MSLTDEKERVRVTAQELRRRVDGLSSQRATAIAKMIRQRVGQECGPEVPELIGLSEAAEIVGAATGNVQQLAGFPSPVLVRKRGGSLWLADEVHEFAAVRRAFAVGVKEAKEFSQKAHEDEQRKRARRKAR